MDACKQLTQQQNINNTHGTVTDLLTCYELSMTLTLAWLSATLFSKAVCWDSTPYWLLLRLSGRLMNERCCRTGFTSESYSVTDLRGYFDWQN